MTEKRDSTPSLAPLPGLLWTGDYWEVKRGQQVWYFTTLSAALRRWLDRRTGERLRAGQALLEALREAERDVERMLREAEGGPGLEGPKGAPEARA